MTHLLLLPVAVAVASWAFTAAARRYSLERAILDIPNERSSHSAPTPRGGGIAIAGTTLAGFVVAGWIGWMPANVAIGLIGGSVLVAAIGWIDDRHHVSAAVRIAVHLLAAVWLVVWIGGFPKLDLGVASLRLGVFGSIVAIVGLVWLINLYNFMDGIDGLATSEAVYVGLFAAIILILAGRPGFAGVSLIVAAACAGFLVWNWPPARIFMGDVGSGLLGFQLGALTVISERTGAVPVLVWLMLLGVFVFDATLTLMRRVARGERWYAAHRSHAYQRAVQAGWSHAQVTWAVLGINALLGLLAMVASLRGELLLSTLAVATVVLLLAYAVVERARPMGAEAGAPRGIHPARGERPLDEHEPTSSRRRRG